MQAIFQDTAPAINSIWAAPGRYTVKLTVNGQTYSQPLTLKMDPRVKDALGVQQQSTMSKALYDDVLAAEKALAQVRAVRAQLAEMRDRAGSAADAIAAFDKKALEIEGATGGGRGGRGGGGGRGALPTGPETLSSAAGSLSGLIRLLEAADVAPTTQLAASVADRRRQIAALMQRWTALKTTDLATLNAQLKQANLPAVK
jgi:hypothetical protein